MWRILQKGTSIDEHLENEFENIANMRWCDKQPWKGLVGRPYIEQAMNQMIPWPS
jgi:hypothetical protein